MREKKTNGYPPEEASGQMMFSALVPLRRRCFCPHRRSKTASGCRPEPCPQQIRHSEPALLFPFCLRRKDRLFRTRQDFRRIVFVEPAPARRIDLFVIGAVVNQKNALRRYDRRRARLYNSRVKRTWATRQNWVAIGHLCRAIIRAA